MGKLKEYVVTIATANRTWTTPINTYSVKAAINSVRSMLDPEVREHANVFIDTQSDLEKFKDIEPGKELLDEMNNILSKDRKKLGL